MRFHHPLFQPLHFDFGTMMWSVNHMPLFGAILSVADHRRLGVLHNMTFYAVMKVLTNGRINQMQAQSIFDHIDLALKGDLSYSEVAFLVGIVVSHKDNMEREFLYMNAWKMWVTFNENGLDNISTREFRRSGLFFDFDYPTMYEMFKDYNWDDEKRMEFERFRFYLMSCIHFRQVRRYQARYVRYRQFRRAVIILLQTALSRVLRENVYPSPLSIVKAIKTIKIPPIEGAERHKHWTDIFDFTFMRNYVRHQWEFIKLFWITKMEHNRRLKCCCRCITCGFWCFDPQDAPNCCGLCHKSCKAMCKFYCRRCRHKEFTGTAEQEAYYKKLKAQRRIPGRRHYHQLSHATATPIIVQGSLGATEVPLELEKHPVNIVPDNEVGNAKKKRKQEKLKKRLVEMEPEIEWRPLGKPRCGIM